MQVRKCRRGASRNLKSLLDLAGRSPLYAVGEAVGCAVGVTAKNLILVRAGVVGPGSTTRYPLRDVLAVEMYPGVSASRLHVVLEETTLVILFWSSQLLAFGQVEDCIHLGAAGRLRARVHARPSRSVGRKVAPLA